MSPDARTPNRLANQTSPYLLQHAHNPVDWYPWGQEAFDEARRRDVPIFLSIGYSTCYWCHVMERESFENAAIARLMNERFVNIKVDREERPDVDDVYMTATQVLSGRGGWPMSAFLEPQHLRPFWCGTYFPPEAKMGMPAFPQVLESISDAWRSRRGEVLQQSERVAEVVAEYLAAQHAPVALGVEQVSKAVQALLQMLDRSWGGFGSAPKFPQPVYLEFLLDVREGAGDDATRTAIDHALRLTLDKMAIGGLRDQVGGGFHRYSVDPIWTVPHFEKMLYDNAQLASIYAQAGRTYDDEFYRNVAASTIGYITMEMTSPDGAFFSAQDAEVDGREGANYVWTMEEIRAALEQEDAEFAAAVYGLDQGPNFRDPHHADAHPVNVLRLDDRPERIAERMGMSPQALHDRLAQINCALYGARSKRKQPRLDDKVLTSWNGLMIRALAHAGSAQGDPRYLAAAAKAAAYIEATMRSDTGLLRTCREGRATTPAFLEDYACLIAGLIALDRAEAAAAGTGDPAHESRHVALARTLAEEADQLFGDAESGGYFDTRAEQTDLFVRPRTTHDGAIPAGSTVMLHNLIDLYQITGDDAWMERALRCTASLSAAIAQSPISAINATRAILRLLALGQGERLASLGPALTPAPEPPRDFTPVEIYASADRVSVGDDAPGHFRVVMKIADGYHINAADPGPAAGGLTPLRIHTVHGAGIAAWADYPDGQPYGPDGQLKVYTGEIEFPVVIERQGEWSGRPLLAATFQACTDTECLEPMTVELDVAIDRM